MAGETTSPNSKVLRRARSRRTSLHHHRVKGDEAAACAAFTVAAGHHRRGLVAAARGPCRSCGRRTRRVVRRGCVRQREVGPTLRRAQLRIPARWSPHRRRNGSRLGRRRSQSPSGGVAAARGDQGEQNVAARGEYSKGEALRESSRYCLVRVAPRTERLGELRVPPALRGGSAKQVPPAHTFRRNTEGC